MIISRLSIVCMMLETFRRYIYIFYIPAELTRLPRTIDEPPRMFSELLQPKIRMLDFAIFLTFASFANRSCSRENTPLRVLHSSCIFKGLYCTNLEILYGATVHSELVGWVLAVRSYPQSVVLPHLTCELKQCKQKEKFVYEFVINYVSGPPLLSQERINGVTANPRSQICITFLLTWFMDDNGWYSQKV